MKKSKAIKFKVGGKATMLFYYMGLVSEETGWVVSKVTPKEIWLENDGHDWKFDAKTGECLNDNTWGDARRELKIN